MKNFLLNEFRQDKFRNGVPFTNDNSKLFSHEVLEMLENDPFTLLDKTVSQHNEVVKKFTSRLNILTNLTKDFIEKNKWIKLLLKKGNVYIVGGFNRDILAGLKPKDIDLVTDLTPKEIVEILKDEVETDLIGEHFGVVMVKAEETFEIATFRKDIYHGKKGLGADEVEFGTLDDDWQRRDFTVNALYFNLKTFELLDPSQKGIKHCLENKFSFIGKAEDRIFEDSIRVMRTFKFIKKGFKPVKGTLEAARRHFDFMMKNGNPERVRTEMEKLIGIL